MTTGTTSTTVTANWTVVKDANGFPTVVGSGDAKVFVNNSTSPFSGEAWSDVDLMDAIPDGATITDLTFSVPVQLDGSRDSPSIACAPNLQFIDKTEYLDDDFLLGYGLFGSGGVGYLPDDNDPHTIDYENVAYASASGGGGILDLDAFAAALADVSTPVILAAQGPQGGATGTSITYSAPLTLTFHWETEDTDPPCDVPITLDLSTASFANPSGDQFGQYVDGIITGLAGNYAQYWFPFTLDATKRYQVTVTFDPSSPHDGDGNPLTSDRFVLLWCGQPGTELAGANGVQIGDAFSNTADTTTITIGPGADIDFGNWDDPDQGVAQGFTRLIFQTSQAGAVSQISIMKICTDDGPTPPVDGGGDDGPGSGGGSSGPTPPVGPGDAPDLAIGFLNPSNRRGAPTEVEVIVDGHWLSLNCGWGEPSWSTTWPGGSANASVTATGIPSRLTRRGLSVDLLFAGERVWAGVLNEPDADSGQLNAVGLFTLGDNFAAIDGSGDATTVPDVAIDAAIARGLRWKRRESISADAQDIDVSQGPVKLGELLDTYTTDNALRWYVDPDGYVATATDPTVPDLFVHPRAGNPTLADDNLATALIGRYRDSGGYATTPPVVDASAQWLGYQEDTIDLTGRGVITLTKAQNKLKAILKLGRARPTFADPIVLQYGMLLTHGQVPRALETARAGQMIRSLGDLDDTQQPGGRTWADIVIGQAEITDRTLTLTPIGAPARSWSDVVAAVLSRTRNGGSRA